MAAGVPLAATRLFGLRGNELVRALPVAIAYGLVLASMYVLKPARNALFLGRFGVEQLPYVLLLVALVGGVSAALYGRAGRPAQARRMVLVLFPFLAVQLVVFWLLLGDQGPGWLVYAFYVWVNLYGLVATSLIWLIANSVFDAREARRAFGFIGAGGIAGAIVGGAFTQLAVAHLGTLNLLLICVVAMLVAAAVAQLPRPLDVPATSARRRNSAEVGTGWAASPLLFWLVPMVGLAAVVSVIVDIQFNAVVAETFTTVDRKTAFFGQFFAVLNLFALVFQLVGTPRILRRLGVGNALLVLPVSLALGSALAFVAPVLAVALLPKSVDGGVRHSLHKAASEILYLPLSDPLKQRAKLFLDSTIDNLGTGVGAVLALLMTSVLTLHHRHLGLVLLVVIAGWVLVTTRVHRAYVDAFRQALLRRELDPEAHRVELSDAASIQSLLAALDSDNDRQIAYSLQMLASVESEAVIQKALPLLSHSVAEIRVQALRVLQAQPGQSAAEQARALVADEDPRVRVAAMYYLCTRSDGERAERLREFLDSGNDELVAAALGCLAEHWPDEAERHLTPTFIAELLERQGAAGVVLRRELARLAGSFSDPSLAAREQLTRDESPAVLGAAIEAAGRRKAPEHVPWLLQQLANRQVRVQARSALAGYGVRVLPALRDALTNPEVPKAIRRGVARVLARIGHQKTVDLVAALALDAPAGERLQLLKTLNKLRERNPRLRFDRGRLAPLLDDEVRLHARLVALCRAADKPVTPPARLLWRALGEKQGEALERAFRVLGLLYPPKDIYNAYLGVVSGNRVVKASAIEFLDNLLARDDQRQVVPMLEAEPLPAVDESMEGHWLLPLMRSRDAWLRACAVFNADPTLLESIRDQVQQARRDPDPIVRETADLVLRRGGM